MFASQMLVQRQEAEQELQQNISKLEAEKQSLCEHCATLQRPLGNIETESRSAKCSALRLEKDKSALKKTLD